MSIIRNIIVRVGGDISDLSRSMSAGQLTMATLAGAAAAMTATVAVAFAAASVAGTKMAIQYEASVAQMQRIFGASSKDFLAWSDSQALAFSN